MTQAYWSPAFKNIPNFFGHLCQGTGMPAWLYPWAPHTAFLAGVTKAEVAFFANEHDVQQGFVDVWTYLARRYADEPTVVAFDLINEPVTHRAFPVSELHLDDLYARLAPAVHAVDPNALLIFQDNNDFGKHEFSLTGPPPVPNVVYCYHGYGFTRAAVDRIANHYLARAAAWNVPLWNGEWPMFGADSPQDTLDPTWPADVRWYERWARKHDVGWNVFQAAPRWLLNPAGTAVKPDVLAAIQAGY